MMIDFRYEQLDLADVAVPTLADYLVLASARFSVLEGQRTLLSESQFPVLELARDLNRWASDKSGADFQFKSMSYEEVGIVQLVRIGNGWIFRSVFAPGCDSAVSDWNEISACIGALVSEVRVDLRRRGVAIDIFS